MGPVHLAAQSEILNSEPNIYDMQVGNVPVWLTTSLGL